MSQTMREALNTARAQIVLLGGVPDPVHGDDIQRAVLEQIDAALSAPSSEQEAAIDRDEQTTQWVADGGFFHRFGGEDHACMPLSAWRASRPAAAAPTAEQILALERRSPMSDDEALRFGRAVLLLAERAAAAAPAVGVADSQEAMAAAYMRFCRNRAPDHNEVGFPYFKAAWQDRAALAGAAQGAEPSALRGALEEIAAMEYDKWSNGARAGEIARNALAMQSQSIPVTGATVADRLDALADREQAGSQAASDLYAAATIWRKHLKAGVAQGAEPPDHFPPREAFIWNLGFRAGAETATLDVVQAAADASSVGHLSALLDIQTALLGRAMAVMKAVEGAASPANEGSGDFTATIPYGAWAEFVDARAGLLYAVAQSPIGASPQPTAPEKKE